MRNKAKFIEDFESVAKPEIIEAVDPVQDAAHTMNQLGEPEEIDDYFYIGKGE